MSSTTKIYEVQEKVTNPPCTALHQIKRINPTYKYKENKLKI